MKALVTGGSGFIGSNVVQKLLSENCEVRVLDNLSSGFRENLSGLDVEFVEGDVLNPDVVRDVGKGIDVVFHLAASVGRQRSIDFPQRDASTNFVGTINVLESMKANGIPRIVYSSSAAIFGELLSAEIDESHPQNADSPYGVSKLAAEKIVLAYCGIYPEINATCLRYFNIYGVNQRYDSYGNVIPIFANRLLSGRPLSIYGDGTQTRDFLNVVDVARANWLGANADFKADVFNMGSGRQVTIQYLAELMQKVSGANTGIEYLPERKADVKHCKADSRKAETKLGFAATVDLEEGIERYWEWFKIQSNAK